MFTKVTVLRPTFAAGSVLWTSSPTVCFFGLAQQAKTWGPTARTKPACIVAAGLQLCLDKHSCLYSVFPAPSWARRYNCIRKFYKAPVYQVLVAVFLPTKPQVFLLSADTDITGLMGLPCGMVHGVPADRVVEACIILVVEDMVVNKVDGLVGNKVRG